jgi:hypothetical protein
MNIDLLRPESSCAGEDCNSLLGENSDAAQSRTGSLTRCRHQRSCIPLSDENDDEDDQAQMDLALNTNFDLVLFDYNWSDEPNNNTLATTTPVTEINTCNRTCTDVRDCCTRNSDEDLLCSSSVHVNCVTSSSALHPHAIPSSANCPPIKSSTISLNLSHDVPDHDQPKTGKIGKSRSEQPTTEMGGSNRNQTLDWNTSPSTAQPTFNPVHTSAICNSMTNGTFFLSNQMQELIARQSVSSMLNSSATSSAMKDAQPPFLLFDAPIELRANFMASQRAHGFPILDDNNTFHYQHQTQASQHTFAAHLVDGRHGGIRNKRVKNEREQKRTQKITDLIDQLRDKMEQGGWKVGGTKSKYATLSTYVACNFCILSKLGCVNSQFISGHFQIFSVALSM